MDPLVILFLHHLGRLALLARCNALGRGGYATLLALVGRGRGRSSSCLFLPVHLFTFALVIFWHVVVVVLVARSNFGFRLIFRIDGELRADFLSSQIAMLEIACVSQEEKGIGLENVFDAKKKKKKT